MSQDRFIELLTKEFIDVLTQAEADEFKALLQNKEYQERYDLFRLYLSANDPDHSSDGDLYAKVRQKIYQYEEYHLPVRSKRTKYWKLAVAAMVTLVSLTIFALYQKESAISYQASTKRGDKRTVTLDDGTTVVLNAESKLVYPEEFNGEYREVTLIGEGFFDVKKDPKHPFIIHTAKMDIRVVGTAFNVKSYPGDRFFETTLIRGLIEVTLKDRPEDRITLRPSEKLIVQNVSEGALTKKQGIGNDALTQVTHFQKIDSTVIETSWMQNKIVFNDQTLSQISEMLERAYDVEINFSGEEVKDLRFTGAFEKESVEDILRTLRLIEPFSYKIYNNQIIINQTK